MVSKPDIPPPPPPPPAPPTRADASVQLAGLRVMQEAQRSLPYAAQTGIEPGLKRRGGRRSLLGGV